MEKMPGRPFKKLVEEKLLSDSQQEAIAHNIYKYSQQISENTFEKVGSLYYNRTKAESSIEIGPIVNSHFFMENRNSYEFHRGPYQNTKQFYQTYLQVILSEISDREVVSRAERMENFIAAKGGMRRFLSDPDKHEGFEGSWATWYSSRCLTDITSVCCGFEHVLNLIQIPSIPPRSTQR
jgi:hypothetical protein